MIVTKKTLPRRTFLRGMGAAIALPLLDAMVPPLTALAKRWPPGLRGIFESPLRRIRCASGCCRC